MPSVTPLNNTIMLNTFSFNSQTVTNNKTAQNYAVNSSMLSSTGSYTIGATAAGVFFNMHASGGYTIYVNSSEFSVGDTIVFNNSYNLSVTGSTGNSITLINGLTGNIQSSVTGSAAQLIKIDSSNPSTWLLIDYI